MFRQQFVYRSYIWKESPLTDQTVNNIIDQSFRASCDVGRQNTHNIHILYIMMLHHYPAASECNDGAWCEDTAEKNNK